MIRFHSDIVKELKNRTCVIACSGGVDSVALIKLALEQGLNVEIAHVNYHLRGAESEEDEAFVRKLASSLGVRVHVHECDLSSRKNTSGNIQQLARDGRYSFFESLLNEDPNRVVLLAHHEDDQVETFYLNLSRNSGIRGLAAIPAVKERYYRPLLPYSKTAILEFAISNELAWREDQSNQQSEYNRNKLRNIILPELYAAIPSLRESVLFLVTCFQEDFERSKKKVLPIFRKHFDQQFIPLSDLYELNENELHIYFDAYGLSKAQMVELLGLKRKGARVDLTDLSFYRIQDGFEIIPNEEASLPEIELTAVTELPSSFTKETVYLDPLKMSGAIQVRKIKKGDRMNIIGLRGSKLLSDILNDAKAGRKAKNNAVVLVDNEDILWFPGFAISPKAIASEKSELIWKIRIKDEA